MGKLAEALEHPEEIIPMVKMYLQSRKALHFPKDPNVSFCYEILSTVSRSFAVVVQQLNNPLRDAVCVFYLVLRALDTVEDDMAIPLEKKVPLLRCFHEKIYDRGFSLDYGEKHYKRLLNSFPSVVDVFLSLDDRLKGPIAEICHRMGDGMADFIEKDVISVADYDMYCHYVAGLVGIGLGKLFDSSHVETESETLEDLANDMGLFLQKTNIIRDYLEDIEEEPAPRMFWPKDIWGLYANQLSDFRHRDNRKEALKCLNHMIVDALRHIPSCLVYMSKLHDLAVFRFCAIPQVMAIGTLALCYNNGKLFEGVVKMRRGETCVVFDRCNGMADVFKFFKHGVSTIGAKCQSLPTESDPNIRKTLSLVEEIEDLCDKGLAKSKASFEHGEENEKPIDFWVRALIAFLMLGYSFYAFGVGGVRTSLGVQPDAGNWAIDLMQKIFAVLMVIFGVGWIGILGKRI